MLLRSTGSLRVRSITFHETPQAEKYPHPARRRGAARRLGVLHLSGRQEDPSRPRPAGRARDRLQGGAAQRPDALARPARPDDRHHQPARQRPRRHRGDRPDPGRQPDLGGPAGHQERRRGRAHRRPDRPAAVFQRRQAARVGPERQPGGGRPAGQDSAAHRAADGRQDQDRAHQACQGPAVDPISGRRRPAGRLRRQQGGALLCLRAAAGHDRQRRQELDPVVPAE